MGGSINPAENGPVDKLPNMVLAHERMLREMKTSPQPIGAESLRVGSLPADINSIYSFGPYSIPANGGQILTLTFTPLVSLQTLWVFQEGLYVDAFASTNKFPNGTSLTGNQRNLTFSSYDNVTQFNSTTNAHARTVVLRNIDSSAHTYWITLRAFLPLTTGATVA